MAAQPRTPHFADWARPANVTETTGDVAVRTVIPGISSLPVYNILNGDPERIVPYLVRSTLPEYAKWVPIAGMRHEKALECTDAFIKSHIWHVQRNAGDRFNPEQARKVGIILGVCRASIYANYEISSARLNPGETAEPYMSVSFEATGAATPIYRCLVADERTPEQRIRPPPGEAGTSAFVEDPRAQLLGAFTFSDVEKDAMAILARTAQAIIPLQGYSLITDGHHYIPDATRNSYKACLAVEKQHWAGSPASAWLEDTTVDVKDAVWHKAGHPVVISVKEFAATNDQVPVNLMKAHLGGAAARLPAVESEVRAIGAYLRVTNEVRTSFESRGGIMDNSLLQEVQKALSHFPRGRLADGANRVPPDPLVIGAVENERGVMTGGTTVASRQEVITYARELISRSSAVVAVAYGYYVAMSESVAMSTGAGAGRGGGDSLVRAFSLKKLQTEHMTAYAEGMEYFRDHQSARSRARKEGRVEAPRLVIT